MDAPQRHKRSFTEMSQQATLSPSPFNFRESPSLFLPRSPSAAPSRGPNTVHPSSSFHERRRTPHPHNSAQSPHGDSLNPSANASASRLGHRASHLVIDLTEDQEGPNPTMPRRARPDGERSHQPPQLGRSDASGLRDVVDLTDDHEEQEVMITGARELPAPRPRNAEAAPNRPLGGLRLPSIRAESPSLFVPRPPEQHAFQRALGRPLQAFGAALGFGGVVRRPGNPHELLRNSVAFVEQLHAFAEFEEHLQHIPGLDYRTQGLGEPRKPDHVPPKAARENFTRSPKEDDVVICPSCDEELVHNKQDEEPMVKKGGKTPTRKEREEHSFWVVKDCGHVYCNNCYQNRLSHAKMPNVHFSEGSKQTKSKATKTITCSVDECESDVKSKDKWIGIFL